jgi:hypothetical protein
MTGDKAANEELVLEGCGVTGPELRCDVRGRSVGGRWWTSPITAQFGVPVAHEVTDEAFAAGRGGEYRSLCGCLFVAAPLVAPPGQPCQECRGVLAAVRRVAAAPYRPRHRRVGLLRRLVPLSQRHRATTGKDITR